MGRRSLLWVLAAQQAGGADVLMPVANRLLDAGDRVIAWARRQAAGRMTGLPILRAPDGGLDELVADAKKVLRGLRPHGIIGNADGAGPCPEKAMVLAAREHGVPVVSVLDVWGGYRERWSGAFARGKDWDFSRMWWPSRTRGRWTRWSPWAPPGRGLFRSDFRSSTESLPCARKPRRAGSCSGVRWASGAETPWLFTSPNQFMTITVGLGGTMSSM